jgi:hypothetical protein
MLPARNTHRIREDLKKKIVRTLYIMKGCTYYPTPNIMNDLNIGKKEVSISASVLNDLLLESMIESNSELTRLTTKGIVYAIDILN